MPISPTFEAKNVFSKNSGSVMHNFIRVTSTMPKIQRNLMIQFQENTRTEDRMEGQTLFHRILPAAAGGLTRTTAVDWHLKVRDIECDVSLTKNYCITVSMRKISSIHTLILKIQQILGYHELHNGHVHSRPHPLKNQWNNF